MRGVPGFEPQGAAPPNHNDYAGSAPGRRFCDRRRCVSSMPSLHPPDQSREKDVESRPGCVQPLTLLQRRRPLTLGALRGRRCWPTLGPHAANDRHGVSRPAIRHTHLVHISTAIHRRQSCTVWCGLAGRAAKSDGLVVHREHRRNNSPFDGVARTSRPTHEHLMRANEALTSPMAWFLS